MKSTLKKLTAGLLSAGMLLACMQPVMTASAVETKASVAETFDARVHNAWENLETQVSVRDMKLTLDETAELYYQALYTEAEWFYVSSGFKYGTYYSVRDRKEFINFINIEYNYDTAEIPQLQKKLDAYMDKVLAGVQPGWSDAEKLLYLHDVLAEHCEYDMSLTIMDAYAAMLGGSAVCQGYALALCMLCRRVGIPCYTITSDSLNHMWNVVQIDGEWYHCDVTYDDGSPDMLGRATHQYLLVSDAFMMADAYHSASDWNYFSDGTEIVCSSEDYSNAAWRTVIDTMHPLPDGTWFYAKAADPSTVRYASDVKATLCRGSAVTDAAPLRTITAGWDTHRNTVYSICYVTSQVYGDKVYYHDPTSIYEMPLDSNTPAKIYTLNAEELALGEIYGMYIDGDGLLTYQIMAAPAYPSEDNLTIDKTFHTIQLGAAQPEETTETTDITTTTATTTASTTAKPTTTAATTTTSTATVTSTTSTTKATTTTSTTTARPTTVTETTTAKATAPTTTTVQTTTRRHGRTTTATTVTTTTTTRAAATTTRTTTTAAETTVTEPVTTVTEPTAPPVTTVPETAAPPETTVTSETTTTTVTAEPVSTRSGDVNLDGNIDVSDAVLLARLVAEDSGVRISTQGLLNADCNADGERNHSDVLWILRFVAKLL